jgi:hypothetical protein
MEIYGGDKCNGNRKRNRWLLKKTSCWWKSWGNVMLYDYVFFLHKDLIFFYVCEFMGCWFWFRFCDLKFLGFYVRVIVHNCCNYVMSRIWFFFHGFFYYMCMCLWSFDFMLLIYGFDVTSVILVYIIKLPFNLLKLFAFSCF